MLRKGGIGIRRRLAIYREGYVLRLLAALRDSYGHTVQWLGQDRFDSLALNYITTHVSVNRSINEYGEGFADWIAATAIEHPACAELACMDWALRRAFDGPDSAVVSSDQLAEVKSEDWSRAGFMLVPTWRLLEQRFNTLALWLALDRNEAPPETVSLASPQKVLVWRRGHNPHFRSVDAQEAAALVDLDDGVRFSDLCAALAQQTTDAQAIAKLGRWLHQWVSEDLLAKVTLD